jgi:hypothetical protein
VNESPSYVFYIFVNLFSLALMQDGKRKRFSNDRWFIVGMGLLLLWALVVTAIALAKDRALVNGAEGDLWMDLPLLLGVFRPYTNFGGWYYVFSEAGGNAYHHWFGRFTYQSELATVCECTLQCTAMVIGFFHLLKRGAPGS